LSYQKATGPLMANSHPGSYCGQDAYNDMFVTENKNEFCNASIRCLQGNRNGICSEDERLQGCHRSHRGGEQMNNIVRRLTVLECERLQGFPDDWTNLGEWTDSNGKKHKDADSPRYKAIGNSIALPFWQFLARRICAQYERDITMGSLFDGIGGFPLVFSRCGAVPVWASEIEEFPIAVTKKHFHEEE